MTVKELKKLLNRIPKNEDREVTICVRYNDGKKRDGYIGFVSYMPISGIGMYIDTSDFGTEVVGIIPEEEIIIPV